MAKTRVAETRILIKNGMPTGYYKLGHHGKHKIHCVGWKSPHKLSKAERKIQKKRCIKRISRGLERSFQRGTKDEVYLGLAAYALSGKKKLTKSDFMVKNGKIISKAKHAQGKKAMRDHLDPWLAKHR